MILPFHMRGAILSLYACLGMGAWAQESSIPVEPPIQPPVTGLHLPAIISDHMVLQREARTPIWGWADPGEVITVTAGEAHASATADAKGRWEVELSGLKSSATPIELQVAGKSKAIVVHDVLVGDVWFCSGQSNMEIPVNYISNFDEVIAQAANPALRLFIVFNRTALDPQDDCRGEWKLSSPDTARGFSAIGYLFGREIAAAEHVPVGMIGGYSGGSLASSWMSMESLQSQPETKEKYGDPFLAARAKVPQVARPPGGQSMDQARIDGWAAVITMQWIHDDWYDNHGGKDYADAERQWHDVQDPIYWKWKAAAAEGPAARTPAAASGPYSAATHAAGREGTARW